MRSYSLMGTWGGIPYKDCRNKESFFHYLRIVSANVVINEVICGTKKG